MQSCLDFIESFPEHVAGRRNGQEGLGINALYSLFKSRELHFSHKREQHFLIRLGIPPDGIQGCHSPVEDVIDIIGNFLVLIGKDQHLNGRLSAKEHIVHSEGEGEHRDIAVYHVLKRLSRDKKDGSNDHEVEIKENLS